MHKLRLALMVVFSLVAIGGAAVLAMGRSTRSPEEQQARGLLRNLVDSDPEVRRDAEHALKGLDRHALPVLREASQAADGELARRARRLLDEMEGRTAAPRIEAAAAKETEPPVDRPTLELLFQVQNPAIRSGEPIRFYLLLRNNGSQPVLLARHKMRVLPLYREFARFEVEPSDGEPFAIAPDLWPRGGPEDEPTPEIVSIPAGESLNLYAGCGEIPTSLHARLVRPGEYRVRFVYEADATYRDTLAGLHAEGMPLPAGTLPSNTATIVVQ